MQCCAGPLNQSKIRLSVVCGKENISFSIIDKFRYNKYTCHVTGLCTFTIFVEKGNTYSYKCQSRSATSFDRWTNCRIAVIHWQDKSSSAESGGIPMNIRFTYSVHTPKNQLFESLKNAINSERNSSFCSASERSGP